MIRHAVTLCLVLLLAAVASPATASIFLPASRARSLADLGRVGSSSAGADDVAFHRRRSHRRALQRQTALGNDHSGVVRHPLAMAIPGNGLAEQVVIGGFGNFISIYNTVITARILLSWFPQAQTVGALQPLYQITDPYLNLFRGLLPPIFGLDFSPILAFVTLNLLQTSTVSLAAEVPREVRERLEKGMGYFGAAVKKGKGQMMLADV